MIRIRDCREDGVRVLWAFVRSGNTLRMVAAEVVKDADSYRV